MIFLTKIGCGFQFSVIVRFVSRSTVTREAEL
jgi:hypothetical protein